MQFTESDESLPTLLARVKQKYGSDVQIIEQKTIPKKGISGMLGNHTFEITGFCPDTPTKPDPNNAGLLRSAIQDIRQEKKQEEVVTRRQFQQLQKKIDMLIQRDAAIVKHSYPELEQIERVLIENDFDYLFIQEMLTYIRRFFTIEQIKNSKKCHAQLIEWIAERIHIAEWQEIHNSKITILIGPTGVGKTTTLAKIAKLLAFGAGTNKIADIGLFTIDNYRLAAKEQLDGYGRSMGTPVKLIRNVDELKSSLALHEQDRHILIDTIGRSPHESISLGSMNDMLQHCGKDATYSLVVSATTKKADLELIKKHYHPFGFCSIIVTKLDETDSIGNIISAFAQDNVPFVYYTHGQKVPLDIKNASKKTLLNKIFGFSVNKSDYNVR